MSAIATFSSNLVWITESFPEFVSAAAIVIGEGSFGASLVLSSVVCSLDLELGVGVGNDVYRAGSRNNYVAILRIPD